jgi:DNA-binding XRE family transcriptional regulator
MSGRSPAEPPIGTADGSSPNHQPGHTHEIDLGAGVVRICRCEGGSNLKRIFTIRYAAGMHSETATAGDLLRQARQGAGLSQVELAARAGVTQSVISAYESGHRQPSLPTLTALIEAAGTS